MKDTKELEFKIFACILIKNELLNELTLEDKYFKYKKVLNYLINLYKKYNYIDSEIVISKCEKNSNKLINFILELSTLEATSNNIFGYYKRLKEIFRDNQLFEITEKYRKREIDYKEFSRQMFYLNKSDDFDEDEILTVKDIKPLEKSEREYTEIYELDYLLKGIEYGKLSLWSGITNHGKTTLMIQFAKECVKKHKKIFYFSGEQTAEEFKNYLYVGMCGKEQLEFITDEHNSKIYDVKPKQDIINYFDSIYGNLIHLYNNNIPDNNLSTMLKVMTKAFNQGVRIFFIDNFMQLDNSEKLEEQTRIVESFKRFARNNNCIVNLVAHPRKTQFQKNRLTIFDISGTQNIANKSSNICTIIRTDLLSENEYKELDNILTKHGYKISECNAIVEVLKTKGNYCKMVGLKYDFDTKKYLNIPKQDFKVDSKSRREK